MSFVPDQAVEYLCDGWWMPATVIRSGAKNQRVLIAVPIRSVFAGATKKKGVWAKYLRESQRASMSTEAALRRELEETVTWIEERGQVARFVHGVSPGHGVPSWTERHH